MLAPALGTALRAPRHERRSCSHAGPAPHNVRRLGCALAPHHRCRRVACSSPDGVALWRVARGATRLVAPHWQQIDSSDLDATDSHRRVGRPPEPLAHIRAKSSPFLYGATQSKGVRTPSSRGFASQRRAADALRCSFATRRSSHSKARATDLAAPRAACSALASLGEECLSHVS